MSKGTYLYLTMCLRYANGELTGTTSWQRRGNYALYLAVHGEEEEDEEVDDEDGPVHGDVERLEERAHERDERRARRRQPAAAVSLR